MGKDEKLEKAIDICKKEKSYRWIVFKNNPQKQMEKCMEMDFVIQTLTEFLGDSQPPLFSM